MPEKNPISPPASNSPQLLGVFGWPIGHSLSPAMHNAALKALNLPYLYLPFAVSPEQLEGAIQGIRSLGILGVNLTIPHKETVLPYLDEITENAREVGAVNTLHLKNGKLLGDNTDGRGFFEPLRDLKLSFSGKRALVLGAGGAARSVVFQLVREGAQVVISNRSHARAEALAQAVVDAGYSASQVEVAPTDTKSLSRAISSSELLVQTTKVGMFPESNALPEIPLEALHPDLFVYDLIYNPLETRLLHEAKLRGCRTLEGVKMLVFQGAVAFQIWTGVWPPVEAMERAVLEGLAKR